MAAESFISLGPAQVFQETELKCFEGATTFSITTLSMMTFIITTLSMMTFSITTLSQKGLVVALSINYMHHKRYSAKQHSVLSAIMLNVIMLSVSLY
jgi:hypothetical protein